MKKKIVVRGPALSQSGYGEHCRFILRSLKTREDLFDIYLMNIPWGKTNWLFDDDEERHWIDGLINKTVPYLHEKKQPDFDVSLQVTIANELERMAPINILVTAGIETDRVSPVWIQKCHELADKIIVVSEHAKKTFQETKIKAHDEHGNEIDYKLTKPIEVINYPIRDFKKTDLKIKFENDFNFLCVSQWGPRKNFENTVQWFMEEFKDDDVGLVIKTHLGGNSIIDKANTETRLKSLINKYSDSKCKVYLLHGYMNKDELHSLYSHSQIKALINFTHGEGYGLPMFEAAYCGLPVIGHDWGGQKDFLYALKKNKKGKEKLKALFCKVPYTMATIQDNAVWRGVLEPESMWAFVQETPAKIALRDVKKNYGMYKSRAKSLKKWLLTSGKFDGLENRVCEVVYGDDIPSNSIEDLPKISIITSVYDGDEFIEPFLEDITRQTIFEEKCQLILIDANSPGNEEKIIKKYLKKYPNNIVYKKLKKDPGIYGSWNKALELATGEYITNANLDDRKAPDSLERHARELCSCEDVDLVYADSFITNAPNEAYENNTSNGRRYNFEQFSKQAMLRGNQPHNNPMWRKKLHNKFGKFNSKYRSAGDWEFFLRCAFGNAKFKKINQVLGLYYFNPKGISTNSENFSWKREEEKEIHQKYIEVSKQKEDTQIPIADNRAVIL